MAPNSPASTTLVDRAVIRLSGEDAGEYLQGLVTQDVTGPLPVWAGLLTAQGKCLFDFLVWADGDDLLLDCEAETAGDLIKRLSIYRLRRPIKIERDDSLAVHWSPDGDEGVADPRLAELGRRWLAQASEPATGWLEQRLRLGVCEGRAELGDLLWLECNAAELNGVSFTKGCFIGQENTARMNWRQKVNRRLLVVPLDRSQADRQRAVYPELGLAIDHVRVSDIAPELLPDWLQLDEPA